MKSIASLVILLSLSGFAPAPGQARTATQAERAACEAKIQSKIDAIDSRMRVPYGAEDGERLRERRRKLEEQRANCRTKNEATRASASRQMHAMEKAPATFIAGALVLRADRALPHVFEAW